MTNRMKWVLIAGALLVSTVLVWMEWDRGRYVFYTPEFGGILDTRTGTIYSGDNLSPQKIGGASPYWNRRALTAKFEKADCQPGDIFDFVADAPTTGKHNAGTKSSGVVARIDEIAPADCYLGIRFVVKNDTPEDVQIEHGTVIWPWAVDSGAFDRTGTHGARVREDLSVPAGLSETLQVSTADRCEGHANDWDACLKQDFDTAKPLVVFLKEARYEIQLPLR